MSIYDLPGIAREAWPRAATQANITNGFKVSGIHPINSGVFKDMDFAPAYVTDRPSPYSKPSGCGDANTDTASSPRREESQPEETHFQGCTETELQTPDDIMNTPFATINSQLQDINREVANIPMDGHCLLHAVAEGLAEEGIDVVTVDSLCTMLVAEVTNHADHYRQFFNGRNVIEDIDRYTRFKEYNNDTADLILSALCSNRCISTIIYNQTASGVTNILATGPGRPNVVFKGDIYLVLTGANGNGHYRGVRKLTTNSHAVTDPLLDTPHTTFSPERIRPFPKAPPRKTQEDERKEKVQI